MILLSFQASDIKQPGGGALKSLARTFKKNSDTPTRALDKMDVEMLSGTWASRFHPVAIQTKVSGYVWVGATSPSLILFGYTGTESRLSTHVPAGTLEYFEKLT